MQMMRHLGGGAPTNQALCLAGPTSRVKGLSKIRTLAWTTLISWELEGSRDTQLKSTILWTILMWPRTTIFRRGKSWDKSGRCRNWISKGNMRFRSSPFKTPSYLMTSKMEKFTKTFKWRGTTYQTIFHWRVEIDPTLPTKSIAEETTLWQTTTNSPWWLAARPNPLTLATTP